jgi:hypothetical protein
MNLLRPSAFHMLRLHSHACISISENLIVHHLLPLPPDQAGFQAGGRYAVKLPVGVPGQIQLDIFLLCPRWRVLPSERESFGRGATLVGRP